MQHSSLAYISHTRQTAYTCGVATTSLQSMFDFVAFAHNSNTTACLDMTLNVAVCVAGSSAVFGSWGKLPTLLSLAVPNTVCVLCVHMACVTTLCMVWICMYEGMCDCFTAYKCALLYSRLTVHDRACSHTVHTVWCDRHSFSRRM